MVGVAESERGDVRGDGRVGECRGVFGEGGHVWAARGVARVGTQQVRDVL